jgi:hypothetical protein
MRPRTLKERYLPLRVIRDQMASLSEDALERLAGPVPPHIEARFNEVENSEEPTNAHIIAAQQLAPTVVMSHRLAAFTPTETDYRATTLNETGFDFLNNSVREEVAKPKFNVPSDLRVIRPQQAPAPTPALTPAPVATIGDVWHRIVISPSMELHVREDGMQEAGEIRRILASLRKR